VSPVGQPKLWQEREAAPIEERNRNLFHCHKRQYTPVGTKNPPPILAMGSLQRREKGT
jgi:hypothetical protein